MDPAAAVKGEMRFFRKKNQPGGGPSGGSPSDREIPRPPLAPLPPIPAGRMAVGAGCFYACDAGGGDWTLLIRHNHNRSGAGSQGQNAFFPKIS